MSACGMEMWSPASARRWHVALNACGWRCGVRSECPERAEAGRERSDRTRADAAYRDAAIYDSIERGARETRCRHPSPTHTHEFEGKYEKNKHTSWQFSRVLCTFGEDRRARTRISRSSPTRRAARAAYHESAESEQRAEDPRRGAPGSSHIRREARLVGAVSDGTQPERRASIGGLRKPRELVGETAAVTRTAMSWTTEGRC